MWSWPVIGTPWLCGCIAVGKSTCLTTKSSWPEQGQHEAKLIPRMYRALYRQRVDGQLIQPLDRDIQTFLESALVSNRGGFSLRAY